MSKLTHPYGIDLARAKSLGLWMPNGVAAGPRADIGNPLTYDGGAMTFPALGTGVNTQFRRGRLPVVAGVANNVAGWRFAATTDFPFLRGAQGGYHTTAANEEFGVGGFYCSFRFSLGVWPDNTSRFFVGIADSVTNMASADSTAIAVNNYYGIMHDTVDGANSLSFVQRFNGGARTKNAITGGAANPVIAAGRSFWLEIFAWANQPTMSMTLWDTNDGLQLLNITGGPGETAFTGPQCVISNGSTAANAPAMDLLNLYYFCGE